MRCPTCNGANFEVVSPGTLRCVSERIVDAVPPGLGSNFGPQPIPIYGRCGAVASEDQWRLAGAAAERAARAAAERAQAAEDARRAREREQAQLERRRADLLGELRARGNPGLQTRRVPGHYHLSLAARLFGRVGEDRLVEVEPAWPVGAFTWMEVRAHGTEHFEDLPTGLTPTQRLVPMRHGTEGDDVEMLYARRTMPRPGLHPGASIRTPAVSDIVTALERALRSR